MRNSERRLIELSACIGHKAECRDNFEHRLLEEAYSFGQGMSSSLRSIAAHLAEFSYENGHLLPNEFLHLFNDPYTPETGGLSENPASSGLDLARLLIDRYIENLHEEYLTRHVNQRKKLTTDGTSDYPMVIDVESPDFHQAKDEFREFIAGYKEDSNRVLGRHIEISSRLYPNVDFSRLFDQEIKEALLIHFRQSAASIAQQKARTIFDGNTYGEKLSQSDRLEQIGKNRIAFILSHIFDRVIDLQKDGSVVVDREAARNLLGFIDEQGFNMEKLYIILYEEFRKMSACSTSTREKVARLTVDTLDPQAKYAFMADDFDFDQFFHQHFVPLIRHVRSKKIPRGNVRLLDVSPFTPKGMATAIYPRQAIRPIAQLVRVAQGDAAQIEYAIRQFFNYIDAPCDLPFEKVEALLSHQLEQAGNQIEYTIEHGLAMRPEDDQIRQDCRYLPEIVNCRSVRDLILFMGKPSEFKKKYPDRAAVPDRQIMHQSCKMLELVLLYRQNCFLPEYQNAGRNCDTLENHLRRRLDITDKKQEEIKFRVKMLINEDGQPISAANQKGICVPQYDVVFDPESLAMNEEETIDIEIDGKRYRYYPVEKRSFVRAKCKIPNGKEDNALNTSILVYSADGNLIRLKSRNSYLSSVLRGKRPTDILRWAVVVSDQKANDALRDFIYENYAVDPEAVIVDHHEDRLIKRTSGVASSGSKVLASNRGYSSTTYATLAGNESEGQVSHQRIAFETQIFDLKSMLIYNASEYTVSSHGRVYTPQREYSNLFEYFFPPIIYGKRYADHMSRGFRGDDNIA